MEPAAHELRTDASLRGVVSNAPLMGCAGGRGKRRGWRFSGTAGLGRGSAARMSDLRPGHKRASWGCSRAVPKRAVGPLTWARPGSLTGRTNSSIAGRLSNSVIALSKEDAAEDPPDTDQRTGLFAKLAPNGGRRHTRAPCNCWRIQLRQTIEDALSEARSQRRSEPHLRGQLRHAGRRRADHGRRRTATMSYQHAIRMLAQAHAAATDAGPADTDGISIKLSALHPRYEDAQRERVLAELVPRVRRLCEQRNAHHRPLMLKRLWSLDVFEALLQRAHAIRRGTGFGSALQAYQTRSLEPIEHVGALGTQYGVAADVPPGWGAPIPG